MSRNRLLEAQLGAVAGVVLLAHSLVPAVAHAAGSDAQAAIRPATSSVIGATDPANRNPSATDTLIPSAPVLPVAAPELDCLIEPYMSVELATSVSGIVKVVNVDRGDLIRTGQVLAQLEAEVEKANVARERARAEFAGKKYHRMHELYKEQMVSAQQMEEAKADSELAAAELKKAVEMLNQRTVYAPFNGVVVDRFVSPGELVESKKVLKVAQINPLSVEVIAPIAMLGEFKIGGKVRVAPEGPMAGPYEARVKLVDRVVDAASGSFRVRLALPNPRHQVSAGVRCKAQIMARTVETATTHKPHRAASKKKTVRVPAVNAAVAKPGVARTDTPVAPNAIVPASTAGEATPVIDPAAEAAKPAVVANPVSGSAESVPATSAGTGADGKSVAEDPALSSTATASIGDGQTEVSDQVSDHKTGSASLAVSDTSATSAAPTGEAEGRAQHPESTSADGAPTPSKQSEGPESPKSASPALQAGVASAVPEPASAAESVHVGVPPGDASQSTVVPAADAATLADSAPAAIEPTTGSPSAMETSSSATPDAETSTSPTPEKADTVSSDPQKPGASSAVPSAVAEAGAQL